MPKYGRRAPACVHVAGDLLDFLWGVQAARQADQVAQSIARIGSLFGAVLHVRSAAAPAAPQGIGGAALATSYRSATQIKLPAGGWPRAARC